MSPRCPLYRWYTFVCSIVRSQWGYDWYFSNHRSNSRGVAILLYNNFECGVIEVKKDVDGNMLILKMKLKKKITLITIYDPNSDTPEFLVV